MEGGIQSISVFVKYSTAMRYRGGYVEIFLAWKDRNLHNYYRVCENTCPLLSNSSVTIAN